MERQFITTTTTKSVSRIFVNWIEMNKNVYTQIIYTERRHNTAYFCCCIGLRLNIRFLFFSLESFHLIFLEQWRRNSRWIHTFLKNRHSLIVLLIVMIKIIFAWHVFERVPFYMQISISTVFVTVTLFLCHWPT